jgi:DNA-binding Xre family transcriptional regulator
MKLQVKIREVCQSKGIKNGYELKLKAKINPSTAYRLFNNNVKIISLETLGKLCTALDCEAGELFVKRSLPAKKKR